MVMVYLTLGINVRRNLVCLSATVVRTLTVTALAIAMTCALTSLARPSSTVARTVMAMGSPTTWTVVLMLSAQQRIKDVHRAGEVAGVVTPPEEVKISRIASSLGSPNNLH
jgi:hypothetical protein